MTTIKGHWQLLAVTAVIFALFSTPLLYPLRILAVFFHELSHAAAAILTGGSVDSLSLSANEGGLAFVRGGNRFLILTAGYMGSLLIGVALFLVALRSNLDRAAVAMLGICTLLITALFIRDGFPVLFCTVAGAVMLIVARWLPHGINDMLLRIIGLTSMLYAPYDIISDTITRSHLNSDARMLANEFGGATLLWGGLWLMISLAVIAVTLRYGLGPNSNITLRGNSVPPAPPRRAASGEPPA
ncbi:MAG: hypothetical protein RLZZ437_514 [Pseudomonadota bacterium]